MFRQTLGALLILFISLGAAAAQTCSTYPNTLTNGQTADATQVMANFDYILNCGLQYSRLPAAANADVWAGTPNTVVPSDVLRSAGDLVTTNSGSSTTVTITIASPGVVTWNSHGLAANTPVVFSTTGALPTGLTAGTIYYVVGSSITTNTFQVSASVDGSAINTSGSQSGTQTGTAHVLIDFNAGVNFAVTLTTNSSIGAPIHYNHYTTGCIYITQDAAGSRTAAWDAGWKFPSGTAPTLSTAANAVDIVCYAAKAVNFVWSPGANKALQ